MITPADGRDELVPPVHSREFAHNAATSGQVFFHEQPRTAGHTGQEVPAVATEKSTLVIAFLEQTLAA